jgi:hypothetical protein
MIKGEGILVSKILQIFIILLKLKLLFILDLSHARRGLNAEILISINSNQ